MEETTVFSTIFTVQEARDYVVRDPDDGVEVRCRFRHKVGGWPPAEFLVVGEPYELKIHEDDAMPKISGQYIRHSCAKHLETNIQYAGIGNSIRVYKSPKWSKKSENDV